MKRVVLVARERAVEVVVAALAVARGGEGDRAVDRVGADDRRDGVVEVEVPRAEQLLQRRRQRRRGERPGGDDRHAVRQRGDLGAPHGDARVRGDRRGHRRGESLAVDRQRRARRHRVRVGAVHHQRAELAHLLLEQADGGVARVVAKGVGADQLGQPIGLVRFGAAQRPHLDQVDVAAGVRGHPRRLAAGEAAADHRQAPAHSSSGSAIVSL